MLPFIILGSIATYLITKSFDSKTIKKRKRIFISFAMEDIEYRDHLVAQSKIARSPFKFTDMSVKKRWEENLWKKKCRSKIKGCHGTIVLISKNTLNASGVRWEIRCAKEQNKKIIGLHIRKNDTNYNLPIELQNEEIALWTWENLEKFIRKL
jgi:hypothetical protein